MARPRKMIFLEEQIKKQEETVLKVCRYSGKEYKEIMAFICSEGEIN